MALLKEFKIHVNARLDLLGVKVEIPSGPGDLFRQ